jgi:cyanophycin synthetase
MRLVEVRLLDGPNLYRMEPAVKVEVIVGRRRSWYGQRRPGRHAIVRLGATVPRSRAPSPVRDLAAWVLRLHRLSGADAWLASETSAGDRPTRLPVTLHRSSEPGHWMVAFPWRERDRAEEIARAAYALAERGLDPRTTRPLDADGGSRTLARALRAIGAAHGAGPAWVRDAERRLLTVSISGTNGKSTTTRLIAHILRSAGRHVGAAVSDGVLIDGRLVEAGDLTGPLGAARVFGSPGTEVAVLETARGGLLLRGLGYESNDAAVLTNVSSDHLDLQGLHTLPELAEVKSIIARVTRPEGTVVLNAEDPLVAAVAREVRARVCWFALEPSRPPARARLARHLAAGGRAMVLEGHSLVEREGERRRHLVDVREVPVALGGAARHNVANALAAAGAARALGASLTAVADGLRSFAPSAELAPGRLNLYRRDRRLVIVDFAHNEAGLQAAIDVAVAIATRAGPGGARGWVSAIVGTAGDRPDDTLRGIGRLAAERADAVAIKETLRYLRGRSRQSVVGEIRAGISDAVGRSLEVPVYEDEPAAVRGELTAEGRPAAGSGPGVLLLMCHADRAGVEAALAELGFEPLAAASLADPLGA